MILGIFFLSVFSCWVFIYFFSFICHFVLFCFGDRFSCPGTWSVGQAGLNSDLPSSAAYQVLGLKVYTITTSHPHLPRQGLIIALGGLELTDILLPSKG